MRLREIMTTDVIRIGLEEPAEAAWSLMRSEGIRHLVVTEGRQLVGVLSQRDLGGAQGGAVRRGRKVRELMTDRPAVAGPETTLRQAANLMHGRLIGSLPIVEDDEVVGIVTATDVLEELGRGSSRPTVRAKRQSMRLPPAGQRAAVRRAGAKRGARTAKQTKRGRGVRTKGGDDAESDGRGGAGEAPSGRVTPTLGRDRIRMPDSARRAPLAARVSRAEKRIAGRTEPAETPAYIRAVGVELDPEDRAYLRRKLGRKLGKFSPQIERTSVRIDDVNGPRGGVDKRCRIKVVLSGLPSVVVEEQHESLQAAMDGALSRAERAVRQITRRREQRVKAS